MLVYEILGGNVSHKKCMSDILDYHINLIREHCDDFLYESREQPVFKSIKQCSPFVKLKARKRKQSSQFSQVFNETFDNYVPHLRQRAVYAHGCITEQQDTQYYLFPTNGFKFIYNPQIVNSSIYEQMYDKISDDQLISQLLIENYKDVDLPEAIRSGSEILFFNTPYYYAVNMQSVGCYDDLLTLIHRS